MPRTLRNTIVNLGFGLFVLVLAADVSQLLAQEQKVITVGDQVDIVKVDFDVPIPVRIKWPKSIKDNLAEINLQKLEEGLKVFRLESKSKPSLARFKDPAQSKCEPDKWCDVTKETTSRADSTGLLVMLSRLSANRYYQFRFEIGRSLTKKETKAFEETALKELDKLFRKPVSGTLNEQNRKVIQRKMLSAVQRSTDVEVRPKKGAFFDAGISDSEIRGPLKEVFEDLYHGLARLKKISSKTNRKSTFDQLNPASVRPGKVYEARKALDALSQVMPTIRKIDFRLTELKLQERSKDTTSSAVLDTLFRVGQAVSKFAQIDEEPRRWLLIGQYALRLDGTLSTPLDSLSRLWTSEQLKDREKNIQLTARSLAKFGRLVDELMSVPHYRRTGHAVAITDGELTSLHASFKKAAQAILAVLRMDHTYLTLRRDLKKRDSILTGFIDTALVKISKEEVYVFATSAASFQTRANWYLSADVGVLYAPAIEETVPYLGVNVYLVPVNKEAPLASFNWWDSLVRRAALMAGMTTKSVAKNDQRKGLVGDLGLMLGIGFRLTDAIRLSGGSLFFKELNPNPLNTDTRFGRSGFVSISIDWDVKSTLGGLGDKLIK